MTRYTKTGKGYWKHKKVLKKTGKTYHYWEKRFSVRQGKKIKKVYVENRTYTKEKPND